jgi:hypothetical protein
MPTALRLDDVADGMAAGPDDLATPGWPSRRPRPQLVRIVCHLTAELPLIVLCIRSMATGWRATSDDAVVAWRAWDVLSAHPTLLGAPTHTTGLGHQAFAPGPALSWLLAVPVHIDPSQGTLWGSTVIALAAIALAVEAGWAAGSTWGALGAAAVALTLVTTETAVLMNLPWTPWQGALWLVAALACAWATGAGRWRWWPGCVVAASISAQAHVVFALTAVGVCALSPMLALVMRSRQMRSDPVRRSEPHQAAGGRPTKPVVVGLVVGLLLWLPSLINGFSGHPGNLTLLWRSSTAAGSRIGYAHALQGLGAASWPPYSWAHRLPTTGSGAFLSIFGTTFHGAPWHGIATLVVLVVLGLWCSAIHRPAVAALLWVSVAATVMTVITIAQTPSNDAFELVYLGVLYWPVGTAATGAAVAGIVVVARSALGPRMGGSTSRKLNSIMVALCAVGLVGLSVGVTVVDAGSVPNSLSVQGGPDVGALSDRAATAVVDVAPHRPFELELTGTSSVAISSAAYPAIAYQLIARGLPVRLPLAFAVGADASRSAHGYLPVVTVDIGSRLPSARVFRPEHVPTRTPQP